MATASGSNGNTVNENTVSSSSPKSEDDLIRTCGTCRTSVKDKSSKLLVCLHTVCPPCYIAKTNGGEFECAICFTKSPATSIVENFVAHGLDANNKPVIKCSNELCTDDAIAKSYCVQCDEHLCSKCKDAHQRIKITREHQLNSVNDSRVVTPISNTCLKHPQEELSLYCKKCGVLTCRDCQLSQEHSGHHSEHTTVQEAAVDQRTNLANYASNSLRKTKKLDDDYQLVVTRLREVEENRQKFKSDLRDSAKLFLQVQQNRVQELGQAVDRACDQKRQELEGVKTPLEQTIAMGLQASKFAQAAASLKDKHSLLQSVQYLYGQMDLTNRRRKECNLNVLKDRHAFDLQLPIPEMTNMISNFGTFASGTPSSTAITNDPNGSVASTSTASMASCALAQVQGQPKPQSPLLQFHRNQRPDQRQSATVKITPTKTQPERVNQPTVKALLNTTVEQSFQSPPAAVVSRTAYTAANNRPPPAVSATINQMASLASTVPPNTCVMPNRPMVSMQQQPISQQLPPQLHQQQQQQYFQQHGQFNTGFMPGMQHAAFRGLNAHNTTTAMPHSPSGVSSTTITPPVAYGGQQMYPNDQRPPMLNQGHPSQQYPPPPLYSSIQDFNQPYNVLQQLQRPTTMPSSIFPDQARYVNPPLVYAPPQQAVYIVQRMGGSNPTPTMPALVPAPAYSQQQQPQQRPLNPCSQQNTRQGTFTSMNETPPTLSPALSSATSPKARHSDGVQGLIPLTTLARNRAASGDVVELHSNKATSTVHPQTGPSTSAPPAPLENATEQSTIDIESGSSSPLDHEGAMAIADSIAQLGEMAMKARGEQPCQPAEEPVVVSEPCESRVQSVVTPPTPAPNVSSTTTDGENSQSENGQLPAPASRTDSTNSPPEEIVVPRRLARKTITYRYPDPNSSATTRLNSCNGTTSSQSVNVGDLGISHNGSTSNVLTSNKPSLNPVPADNDTIDNQESDDQNVTTTDSQVKEIDGYSKAVTDSVRSWDDWCSVCQNGGDLICCEAPGCPRVFHKEHHVPQFYEVPLGPFTCSFCVDLDSVKTPLDDQPHEERKLLTEYDLKVCQRILLYLCVLPESIPFQDPVDVSCGDYYETIKTPMDFSTIRTRLDRSHPQCYRHVLEFIKDLNQVFINCDEYNTEETNRQVRSAGIAIGEEYLGQVQRYFPDLVERVCLTKSSAKRPLSRQSTEDESNVQTSSRRRRLVLHDDDE